MIHHRMKLRSSRPSWASLPAEIRIMILEKIANQKHPGWASLACVCREWQYFLEKINFRKISLQASCLDDFALVSPQRRELVHHIHLSIQLPRYTSKCCPKLPRSPPVRIGSIVSAAIWKLFSILSTWEPADNLALELHAYSPSDCEHWFRNIHLSSDNVEHEGDATTPAATRGHDLQHGWIHGHQARPPPKYAIQRLFRPIHLKFREPLPQVKAVTRFIIRRQLRRCISLSGLALMFGKLDRLERISYEPWGPYDYWAREFADRALSFGMRYLPDTLNSLIIFEDSYKFYDRYPRLPTPVVWHNLINPSEGIDAVFASKSLKLQHLSISFMINAETFFRQCCSTWTWPHLQSLALTSQFLQNRTENRPKTEVLLHRAGVFAQQMPMMHTFVLWNYGKAHTCAFIYRVERGIASVTWRGTWYLKLTPPVVKSWQLVASKLRGYGSELQLKQERIQADIKSHGDAIYHLNLPCQVIEPASLWQIKSEGHSSAWSFNIPSLASH